MRLGNSALSKEVEELHALLAKTEEIRREFEAFKASQYERVDAAIADHEARLDALNIDIDQELYPECHTVIAVKRWLISRGMRLAIMKAAESQELRTAFAKLVSAGIAFGTREGLECGVAHGLQKKPLAQLAEYDSEAGVKYQAAQKALKDLKYTVADEIEALVDAPFDVLAARLTLAEPVEGVMPPSVDQLMLPSCPRVYGVDTPWKSEGERPLDVVVGTNRTHRELRSGKRTVCASHGFGSSFHSRRDGIPMAVPAIPRRGLKMLLELSAEAEPLVADSLVIDSDKGSLFGSPSRKIERVQSFPNLSLYQA